MRISSNRRLLSSRFGLFILIFGLIGCELVPESFPMPAQRHIPDASDPNYFLVRFTDSDIREYVVRDIQTGGRLCWTSDHPEMKFPIQPRAGLRFNMHFWIHSRTLTDTGPVTVVVRINDHTLGSMKCDHDGSYLFDRPVPSEWLKPGEPAHVLAESSPLWISPTDGAHLGYLMEEIGFRW